MAALVPLTGQESPSRNAVSGDQGSGTNDSTTAADWTARDASGIRVRNHLPNTRSGSRHYIMNTPDYSFTTSTRISRIAPFGC